MKKISHNKSQITVSVQIHVEPTHIALIKINNNEKLGKDCVKNKLRRDPTSEKSDLYEFKMALFENGKTEELFFLWKFQMNIKA